MQLLYINYYPLQLIALWINHAFVSIKQVKFFFLTDATNQILSSMFEEAKILKR